ncbi:hypothetical protein F5Y08DRAFT_342587 [Xylaria arbuscula]|nr:hypothetical protein F5Y08DRAFT_342587 [Xylaria arbuscula]
MTEVRTELSEPARTTTPLRASLSASPLEGLLKFGAKLATIQKGVKSRHMTQIDETSAGSDIDNASGLATRDATMCESTQTETDSGYGTTSMDCDGVELAGTTLTFSRKAIPLNYQHRLFNIRALFTESLLDIVSAKQRPAKDVSMKLKYADHDDSIYLVIQCDKRDKKRMQKFFAQSHVKETVGDDITIYVTTGLRQLSTPELKVYKRGPEEITSGSLIKIRGVSRSSLATIGGAISVVKDDRKVSYGMTAGHVLRRLIVESNHQSPYPCCDPASHSDTSYDSDESSYSSDDDRSDVLPGPQSQPISHIGTITEHSLHSAPLSTNHDWALIELCPNYSCSNINQMRIPSLTSQNSQPAILAFKPLEATPTLPSVRVIIPTSRGNKRGKLTPSTSCLLVAPGREFVETHDVVLDNECSLQPGDSGSWVIKVTTGEVYGHVVSIDMFGEANVIPFDHALRDIQAHLRADQVGLPEHPGQLTDQEMHLDRFDDSDVSLFNWSEYDSMFDTMSHTTWESDFPPSGIPTHIYHETPDQTKHSGDGIGAQRGNVEVNEKKPELNKQPGGLFALPSTPRSFIHNGQNPTPRRIIIEPTPEMQLFYNRNRQEIERRRLDQSLESFPEGEGLGSPSHPSYLPKIQAYSGNNDSMMSSSLKPTAGVVQSKMYRGRRKGPLDLEMRARAAFKRKFKLPCAFHRARKMTCTCYDFSKLEEGYRNYRQAEDEQAGKDPLLWTEPGGEEVKLESSSTQDYSSSEGLNTTISSDGVTSGPQQSPNYRKANLFISQLTVDTSATETEHTTAKFGFDWEDTVDSLP